MQKLVPVEEAKALFEEAKDWSVWRWLIEKRTVRAAADRARAALEAAEKKVKAGWSPDLRKAYRELNKDGAVDPRLHRELRRVHAADEEALHAHDDAEETFAEAERRFSASLARVGAQKAIDAYLLHEKAIRQAEKLSDSQSR